MNKVGTNLNDCPAEGKCTALHLDDLRGVISEEVEQMLRERNARRLLASRQALGERWLLHPAKAVSRVPDRVR
jgi:hypothetical protein